jgi:hypothetical protein
MDAVLELLATPRGQILALMLVCLAAPAFSLVWICIRDELHRHAHAS